MEKQGTKLIKWTFSFILWDCNSFSWRKLPHVVHGPLFIYGPGQFQLFWIGNLYVRSNCFSPQTSITSRVYISTVYYIVSICIWIHIIKGGSRIRGRVIRISCYSHNYCQENEIIYLSQVDMRIFWVLQLWILYNTDIKYLYLCCGILKIGR